MYKGPFNTLYTLLTNVYSGMLI